jgi:hypothetical protein
MTEMSKVEISRFFMQGTFTGKLVQLKKMGVLM